MKTTHNTSATRLVYTASYYLLFSQFLPYIKIAPKYNVMEYCLFVVN